MTDAAPQQPPTDVSPPPDDSPANPPARTPRGYALFGAAVGTLIGAALGEISFLVDSWYLPLIGAILGLLLGFTRLRKLIWWAAACAGVAVLILAYTPLVRWLLSNPPPPDKLEPVDAIVAIGAGVFSDGSLKCHSLDRALHAIELLKAGYAPRLILPVAAKSWGPAVEEQMRLLHANYPIEEPGTVVNTHDEAIVVAKLARQHGWHRIILVTNAWHIKRAAALFQKAGLEVLRSPCRDSCNDIADPKGLGALRAFGCWLHEAIGYRVYRWRGWV